MTHQRLDDGTQIITLHDGRRLAYIEAGDPDGKPVFVLHGLPGSRLSVKKVSEQAAFVGARLICPDRPGIGYSDPKQDRKLTDYPDDLTQLADHLNIEQFAVVGVSAGGPYAIACAAKHPNRV
jgi:pimeloyl-ACP methyl ester carboxylesterase